MITDLIRRLSERIPSFPRAAAGVISAPERRLTTVIPNPPPVVDPTRSGPGGLTRRKFFSFFGVGVAMLATPALFAGKGGLLLPSTKVVVDGPLWTKVGTVIRSYVRSNILFADVQFESVGMPATCEQWKGVCLDAIPVLSGGNVGDPIYAGPGGQLTTDPPDEKLWAAGEKARGLKPGQVDIPVRKFERLHASERGDHAELDRYLVRWPQGKPMPSLGGVDG